MALSLRPGTLDVHQLSLTRGRLSSESPEVTMVGEMAVRVAKPEDIRFLAETMYQSMLPGTGHGLFDAALEGTGVDPIRFHEVLLRTGVNNWGQLDRYLVLVDGDGQCLGAMAAFLSAEPDLRPLTSEGVELAAAHLGWSADATRSFWRSYAAIFGLFGRAPQLDQPGEYVLEYAAMRPDFRGRGLYHLLLQAHVKLAQASGFKTVGHTAMIGNDAVFRALTKFGFREHARFSAEYYKGLFPGLIRLIYKI